jgi:hypothetical protein
MTHLFFFLVLPFLFLFFFCFFKKKKLMKTTPFWFFFKKKKIMQLNRRFYKTAGPPVSSGSVRFLPVPSGSMHSRSSSWTKPLPPPVRGRTGPTGRSGPVFNTLLATIWKFGLPSLLKYLGFESNLSSNILGLFSTI